jgi:hypothetical protein
VKIVVALRAKDRAAPKATSRRLAKLRVSIEQMRARVERDLRSSDPDRFLTALAVAVLDETATEPLDAQKKHVRFSDDEDATSVMVRLQKGKRSRVANPLVVEALRNAYEAVEDEDESIFRHATGRVSAEAMNRYLSAFDLTSEKVRGFNANSTLQQHLTATRLRGGTLPRHGRSKQKVLASEFQKALTATAEYVGLDEQLLRAKYIAPGLESSYLKDGQFMREASSDVPFSIANRVAIRSLIDDT